MKDIPPRYAVIGNPVKHSRSPWIHARFGELTGIALEYTRVHADLGAFPHTTNAFFARGGRGLNVTVPFKTQAHDLARDHLSQRARLAQAVNTLWQQDGRLHGCNTDGVGLVRDILHQGVALAGARILLVGAGGAARGVLFPLLESGCAHLRIVNRTVQTAHQLAAHACALHPNAGTRLSSGGLSHAADTTWDIVINASSSSLQGQAPELPDGLYAPHALAYDMMYGAQPTAFLRQAHAQGARHLCDGLGMLVQQAAESFRLWHGVQPDPVPVLSALRQTLNP